MFDVFICVKCKKKKSALDFCRNKTNKNGLDHRCKTCVAKLVKAGKDKKRAEKSNDSSTTHLTES